jgi:CheY-like chemotaxis protein
MDLQMPELGGLEATEIIRREEEQLHRHVPIIAMTAHAQERDRQRCLDAGMDGYLSKPISLATLFTEIARVVPDVTASLEAASNPRPPVREIVDPDAALANLGDDEALLMEVIDLFLVDLPKQRARLRKSVRTGDLDGLSRTVHSLRGAVSNLVARRAGRALDQVQDAADREDVSAAGAAIDALEPELEALVKQLNRMREGRTA